MSDLDQIVNLGSTSDVGFANTGAVDAGICLNLHIIFDHRRPGLDNFVPAAGIILGEAKTIAANEDRKSTRLNSSHSQISYAVFCLKKKKKKTSTNSVKH